MNSESVKELQKCWFADTARGKVYDFAFLTSSGGKFYKFFMTVVLAVPPLTVKIRDVHLIGHVALINVALIRRIQYL